jgi:hypothetical protein
LRAADTSELHLPNFKSDLLLRFQVWIGVIRNGLEYGLHATARIFLSLLHTMGGVESFIFGGAI